MYHSNLLRTRSTLENSISYTDKLQNKAKEIKIE